MPLEEFKSSQPLTVGVELELQLIDVFNYDLTAAASDLLQLLSRESFPADVKPEVTESMIEVSTGVHTTCIPLIQQLYNARDVLLKAAEKLNIAICGGGSHPFQKWFERRIFPKKRFLVLSELYGFLSKQFSVFGQHIHIGCSSANEALWLLHALNRYVPHFIALSASSPYFQGADTGFHSARLNFVYAFPLSGRAPFLLRWEEFSQDYFEKMTSTKIVNSMKDFYWDIRPKPEYGTIELRVCDTPLTIERAGMLAAYLQALSRYLLIEKPEVPEENDYLVYTYNRFQASRFGLDGFIVHPKTHEEIGLREDILSTLKKLEPHAEALGSSSVLEQLVRHIDNDATRLRDIYERAKSMEEMVHDAIQTFKLPPSLSIPHKGGGER